MSLITCPKCHRKVAATRSFCGYCKAPLNAPKKEEPAPAPKKETSNKKPTHCPKCDGIVAKNVRACPHCGHRFSSATAKGCMWVIILTTIATIYAVNSPHEETTAVIKEPIPIIKDDGQQPKRRAFIDELMTLNIVHHTSSIDNIPSVYVAEAFYPLSFNDKQKFIAVIYKFYLIANPKADYLILKNYQTNKKIGDYSDLGLRLD